MGISLYKVVPLIFPRTNANLSRVLDRISYPITAYQGCKIPDKIRMFFQRLKAEFTNKIQRWHEYKTIRSSIDDFFKLAKKALALDCLHRYTMRSVHKCISLNALLAGTLALLGYNTKEKMQRLAVA